MCIRDRYYAACGKYLWEIAQGTSSDTAAAVALTENGYVQNPYDPQPKGGSVVGAFKTSFNDARDKARLRAVRPTTPSAGTRRRIPLV